MTFVIIEHLYGKEWMRNPKYWRDIIIAMAFCLVTLHLGIKGLNFLSSYHKSKNTYIAPEKRMKMSIDSLKNRVNILEYQLDSLTNEK